MGPLTSRACRSTELRTRLRPHGSSTDTRTSVADIALAVTRFANCLAGRLPWLDSKVNTSQR